MTQPRQPKLCTVCREQPVMLKRGRGRCKECDEAYRLEHYGVCYQCEAEHNTRHCAVWARSLCMRHYRQREYRGLLARTGYTGNTDNQDDFNALVQGLIVTMEQVAEPYVTWVNTGMGDYRNPAIKVMQALLTYAQANLRPRAYLYVLHRINRNFPPRQGIPYPQELEELKEEAHETPAATGQNATINASVPSPHPG